MGIGHYTANEFCAAGNGGESCHHWVNGGTSIFEFVIIANAVRNGDVTKALGVLGQGFSAMANSVPAPEGNPVTDGINRASQDAIRDSSNAVKRSLPRSEHINIARTLHEAGFEFDTVEHVDVASLDQRKRSNDAPDLTHRMIVRGTKVNNDIHDLTVNHYSDGHSSISLRASNETLSDDGSELSKRGTSVDLGLKLSFTFPGKMKMNDKSQRKALAHGLAKHWSETAFSQTGWGDYYGLIKDTNKNPMIKFRLSVENGKPDTDADDVFACGNMGFAVTGP